MGKHRSYARLHRMLVLMRLLRIGERQAVVVQALLMGLAVVAALLGKAWVALLDVCRRLLCGRLAWLLPRMVLAGLAVGVVSVFEPYVVGNGYEAIGALTRGGCFLVLRRLCWGLRR